MRMRTRRMASRLESGSSMSSTAGFLTIARPTATRWRWPPESVGRQSVEQVLEAQKLGRPVNLLVAWSPRPVSAGATERRYFRARSCADRARNPGRPGRCCVRAGRDRVISLLSKRIDPSLISSSPAMQYSNVDFPHPDGPRKEMNSPSVDREIESFQNIRGPDSSCCRPAIRYDGHLKSPSALDRAGNAPCTR